MKHFINSFRLIAMLFAMLLTAIAGAAQTAFKVIGTVTDEEGEALIGVTVKASTGKAATITDIDGKYVISLTAPATLTYEFLGMEPQTFKATSSATHDVVMKAANTTLDDVVVVGYGIQKKINLTGAVQSVSSQEILKRSVSNGSSALQGIVPGLTATQSSGAPGADQASIRIRGAGSISSTQSPLVLIDGVEGDLNRLDLNQIESISVLKDAASASIYGARASNGVILVTTKRGTEGKVKVTFNGYLGVNKPTSMPKAVDAVGYLRAVDKARINDNQEPINTDLIEAYLTEGADGINRYDTDWRDLIMKKSALTQNYAVTVSGGSKLVKLFASAGYYKQDGMVANNSFERTNLRLNSDFTVNKWISLGADMGVRQSVVQAPIGGSANQYIGYAMTFIPTLPAINADGSWGYGSNGNNPIATINDGGYNHSVAPEYTARLTANINPFKGLNILGTYTWKRNDGISKAYADNYELFNGGVSMGLYPTAIRSANEERSASVLKQYNVMATYENTFAEKHYLKVMAGMQSEDFFSSSITANRKGHRYDGYEDVGHGDSTTATNSTYRYEWAMLAYVFRLNYIFDDRYLIEFTGRYDGTSRFLNHKRWGFFPSASVGWRISEENFWESLRPVVDNLKIRGSYGRLGNQSIGSYFPYLSAVSAGDSYGYWFDKGFSTGAAQVQLPNAEIGWEKSSQWDVGLDFSLFNSRLSGTFDFYYRKVTDMLQVFPVPEFVALGAPYVNAGDMRNRGWELSLSWNDRIGDFSYFVKGNISDVRNKVLDLYGHDPYKGSTITAEGLPIGSYYGYIADGFFQSYDEINAVDENGNYINAVYGDRANTKPGYIKYRDINGDGKITLDDRTAIGENRAHYEYSLTLGFEWKGIDFSAMFHGVPKKDVYYSGGGSRPFVGNTTVYEYQLDTWSEDNPNAKFPILLQDPNGSHPNNFESSFWVQSGAYCRLKNLVIGYTLPRKWTNKAAIDRLRFYVTMQNLFTIRGNNFYEGFDPETSAGASCYPLNKSFIFGVNLEF